MRRTPFRCRARDLVPHLERDRGAARHRRHAARSGADAARGVGAAGPGKTLSRLAAERTSGALALVSGRSLNDIDLIFAPEQFPAVGGHGAEMRLSTDSEAVATHAPPMDKELKRRLAAIAKLSPGILLEDKGYSLALHYRLAPHAEKAIYEAVSLIRADLPNAPIEVLPGKCVCEIKHSGFNKATGVRELMTARAVQGPPPDFHRRRCHR
jgi:trehalose 6-phosphate phosphatase